MSFRVGKRGKTSDEKYAMFFIGTVMREHLKDLQTADELF